MRCGVPRRLPPGLLMPESNNIGLTHWTFDAQGLGSVDVEVVKSSESLAALVDRLATEPCVGIDTEFLRERTYFAIAGLVQIAIPGTVYLVDPMEVGDLCALKPLLESPSTRKVFHAAGEDVQLLEHVAQCTMSNVFDTQIACGYALDLPGAGYHALVESVCGVSLPKDATRSDWLARPLEKAQLDYAALDAAYLIALAQYLDSALDKVARTSWVEQENERALRNHRRSLSADFAWQRFKRIERLPVRAQHRLKWLATWREQRAQQDDRPRGHVLPDRALVALAKRDRVTVKALRDIDGLHPSTVRRYGQAACDAHTSAQQATAGKDLKPLLPQPAPEILLAQASIAKTALAKKASSLKISPELLSTRKQLEAWLSARICGVEPSPEILDWYSGWRRSIVRECVEPQLDADTKVGQNYSLES